MNSPRGRLALALLARWRESARGLLFVADSELQAEYLAAAMHALAPECGVMVFPRWDCAPFDALSPSRAATGRRMSVLRRLCEGASHPLVLATPDALLQRLPPCEAARGAKLHVRTGDSIGLADVDSFFAAAGYDLDDYVDARGEAAVRGRTLDVFPPGALGPVRIEHDGQRVLSIMSFDPATQRTQAALEDVTLDAASEIILSRSDDGEWPERTPGMEHALPGYYAQTQTLFDAMAGAACVLHPGAQARARDWLEQIADARANFGANGHGLYLDDRDWRAALASLRATPLGDEELACEPLPRFVTMRRPAQALRGYVEERTQQGGRVLLASASERDARALARACGRAPRAIGAWSAMESAEPGELLALRVDLEAGFRLPSGDAVVTAADLLGSRAAHAAPLPSARADEDDGASLSAGDYVVHADHGLAILRGLETIEANGADAQDMIALEFADDARLMAPSDDAHLIWRYAGPHAEAPLDRLDGGQWEKRRARIAEEIAASARELIARAQARAAVEAPALRPPADLYERFAGRFPYFLSPDQTRAIEDTLRDLGAGRPMDRLICGDVGYGKTEIALRAVAAAVFSGRQACVIAPTTVLARQHFDVFTRRFAGLPARVGHLSRFVSAAQARETKKGLADGTIHVAVGTHALLGKDVRFADLALVVIDEEQRFGQRDKQKMRALGERIHVLTMTATPIPRTLGAAIAGLMDMSRLETPPMRRIAPRTIVQAFDDDLVRRALLAERRRGGQSFVVCPRIEDIPAMEARLARLAPSLRVRTIHGKMAPGDIDETMLAFAGGDGDVLLATNIIESGLDLPRANTIVVTRPDRLGLAQLHQLRGRVGRGGARGAALFLTDPGARLSGQARERLRALETHQGPGAGAALSERDMDLRGAGDLIGEEQAGRVRLVGPALYRRMLEDAMAQARGEASVETPRTKLSFGAPWRIPASYAPDPDVRLNLYARLARTRTLADCDAFAQDLEDRFGPMPEGVGDLIDAARLRVACGEAGVGEVAAGPKAIAFTLARGASLRPREGARLSDGRLIVETGEAAPWTPARALALLEDLAG
ncbi:MAG: box helicase domain protein [Hyphomicrobiales bacterium]|nr:box helicase domain protein [Hyphomicrobiales bacterium]